MAVEACISGCSYALDHMIFRQLADSLAAIPLCVCLPGGNACATAGSDDLDFNERAVTPKLVGNRIQKFL